MDGLVSRILQQIRAEMAEQNQAQQAAMRATIQAAVAAQAGAARPPQQPRLKPLKPAKFSGRAADVFNFCHVMKLYLRASGLDLETEEAVEHAATYLEGPAMTWWRSIEKAVEKNIEPPVLGWTDFSELLIAKHRTVDEARAARDRLMDLRQKGSVRDYAQRFQLLMLEIPDMSEADCLFHFYRGLKPHVRVHTEMSRPTTLRAAVEAADVADSTLYHIGRAQLLPSHRQRADRPVPMELGAMRTSYRQPPQPQPPVCYNCGKPGHIKRNCRSRLLAGNRRA